MSGFPGSQQMQQYPQQHPQHMATPWMQPQPAPAPAPVLPPSLEGTILSGVIGAGVSALAVQGGFLVTNYEPQSIAVNAAITGVASLVGGTAAAAGYRMTGNRAYAAAHQAAGMAGVDPQQAAKALRLGGRFGRWGKFNVELPTQTIVEAAEAWNRIVNGPVEVKNHTPDVVNEYYRMHAEQAANMASQTFVSHMPPPHVVQPVVVQPTQQPQYMWQQPPPPNGQ